MDLNKKPIISRISVVFLALLCSSDCDQSLSRVCQVTFYGEEFIQCNTTKHEDYEINTWFKTSRNSGVLVVFIAKNTSWNGFALENGSISSSKTKQMPNRIPEKVVPMVTVNQWYHLHISMNNTMVSYRIHGQSFVCNGSIKNTGIIDRVYLGGMPLGLYNSPANFTGCMNNVTINGQSISKRQIQSPVGGVSFYCPKCQRRIVTLYGKDSSLVFEISKVLKESADFLCNFQFKTRLKEAFLAEVRSKTLSIQFVMYDGALLLKVNSKSSSGDSVLARLGSIIGEQWNEVRLTFSVTTSNLKITMNEQTLAVGVPQSSFSSKRFESLRIGGINDATNAVFEGCIRNVLIQDTIIDFGSRPSWVDINRAVVGGCNLTVPDRNHSDLLLNIWVNNGTGMTNTTDGVVLSNITARDKEPSPAAGAFSINLLYEVTATLVVVLFVLIIIYVAVILFKNKILKRRQDENEEEQTVEYTESINRPCRLSVAPSADDISIVSSNKSLQVVGTGNSSSVNNEQQVAVQRDQRNSLLPTTQCHKHVRTSTQSLRASRSRINLSNVHCGSMVFLLTPQPQKKAEVFTEIPCVILTLQDDDAKFQSEDQGNNVPISKEIHDDTKNTNIKAAPKMSIGIPGIPIIHDGNKLTYQWAYICPDSETECSETSERMKCSTNTFRPFSLRILEANELDEDTNDYNTECYHGPDFQTFRSKSTDNVNRRRDFLKVCFDPYLSSSQGENLQVYFGINSSSDPSVQSSPLLDHGVCRELQEKYRNKKTSEDTQRCGKRTHPQTDVAECKHQKVSQENPEMNRKCQTEKLNLVNVDQRQNPCPRQNSEINGFGVRTSVPPPLPLWRNDNVAFLIAQQNHVENTKDFEQIKQQQQQQQQEEQEEQQQKQQQEQQQSSQSVDRRCSCSQLGDSHLNPAGFNHSSVIVHSGKPVDRQSSYNAEETKVQQIGVLDGAWQIQSPANEEGNKEITDADVARGNSTSTHSNGGGFQNPWVMRQNSCPDNRKQMMTTPKLGRPNKVNRLQPYKTIASSSTQVSRPKDGEIERRKVWKRRSWASGNAPSDIELALKGTVPVKRPPCSTANLLTVPSTKTRSTSETLC